MKKIALAAISATALLALSACGDSNDDVIVEEATVEPAPIEPIVEETTVVEEGDTVVEGTDDTAMVEEAPAE